MSDSAVLERPDTEYKIQLPPNYRVVFHNDSETPFEFVIFCLVQFFGKTEREAIDLTMEIHNNKKGIAGIYAKNIAEAKKVMTLDEAKKYNFPLLVTTEKNI